MPSFDILKKLSDTDKNNKIVYDYNNINIKKDEIKLVSNNVKIAVSYPVNVPNVTYPNGLASYNATAMYISQNIHNNISQILTSAIAELIIEHTAITGFGTLYTCFFLEFIKDSKEKNDLDKVIGLYNNKNQNSISFNLNKTIPPQDYCVVYNSTNSITIMVFTNPIYLNKESADKFVSLKLTPTTLFSNYEKNYIVLPKSNISQRGEDEIYIDCTPTGESAKTIATYNVPIQSEYTRDWGKLDFMKMTIQLLMVFILILTTYFGVPITYKRVVVDNIYRLIKNDIHSVKTTTSKSAFVGKHIRNIIVDWVLLMFSSFIIVFSFFYSITSKNYNYLQYTVYLFIFGILSIATVAFNKSSGYFKEGYIINDLFDSSKYNQTDVNSKKWEDIKTFIKDIASFYMTAFHEENNKKNIKNWSMIGAFLTFTYIFLIIFRWGVRTISHQTFLFLCWFLPLFIIIPSSLVAVLNFYKLDTNPISKPA
jgi:hypothetical protein